LTATIAGEPPTPIGRGGAPSRHYRRDIDGLRGISVLAVVLYHANARLLPGGFLGVDVFFVISGFLITGLVRVGIEERSFHIAEFLDRRIRRIVPALLIVIGSSFVLGALTMFPAELAALGRNMWSGATFTLNLMRFHDGPRADYFAPSAVSNPLLHLWSLGVEEQFYLFWPVALLLLSRGGPRWVRAGTLAIIGAAFATYLTLISDHELAAFYLPTSRMWELLAGGLLTFSRSTSGVVSVRAPSWRAVVGVLGLGMLAVVFAVAGSAPMSRAAGTIGAVAGSLSVIAAGNDAWANRKVMSQPALEWLGLVSYPWYLWHWPLLTFLRLESGRPSALALSVTLAISLLLAAATYAYVERPLRRREARALRRPLLFALLLIAGVGLGTQAGWIVAPVETDRARYVAAATDWDTPGRGVVTHDASGVTLISFGAVRPTRTAVFIGDSHLEHYWPRVEVLQRRLIDSAHPGHLHHPSGLPAAAGGRAVDRATVALPRLHARGVRLRAAPRGDDRCDRRPVGGLFSAAARGGRRRRRVDFPAVPRDAWRA
jgi:Predicted acyltransferases